MTEEEWLLHKNLLKWLHAQQRLIGVPTIFDRVAKSTYNKPATVERWAGLPDSIKSDILSHLSMARATIRESRTNFQFRHSPCIKRWEHASEDVLNKAISNLDSHITAQKIWFEESVDDVRIGDVADRSRSKSAPGNLHISCAYYHCVGKAIYKKIGYLSDTLILHAHRIGMFKDAEAFKVRTYTFGPKKTMPEPKQRDEYLVIQGTAFAFGDTLMAAGRKLEMQVVKAVTERLQKAEG